MTTYENTGSKDTRSGFGEGLYELGKTNPKVVALCADLIGSLKMNKFVAENPTRFFQTGVAEANMTGVAAGLANGGYIPFAGTFAAFATGRVYDQIRQSVAYSNKNVKIAASHAGLTLGEDGATHQMLEDIALMRVLPNMVVIAPGDSVEAEKATRALAQNGQPSYLRLAREKTPIFSTEDAPFEIGKAYVLREGSDVSLFGTGTMTYQLLIAAKYLEQRGINAEVVHVPTIKPLDTETLLVSARKTGRVVTAEEAQAAGGFGSAVSEFLSEVLPMPIKRIGINDRFGESGAPAELLEYFRLTGDAIADDVLAFTENMPRYHQE